jgi:hypothetical protein
LKPSDRYTPQEAAQRLAAICQELRGHSVSADDIEALEKLSSRFLAHCTRLKTFRAKLKRWTEGFSC